MRAVCIFIFVPLVVLFHLGFAYAVLPDEQLANPVLEQRARDISTQMRCLVCQNESIDASNAPLAKDLRLLVRERLTLGDTDQQVVDFLEARYGEFVLLKPRFNQETLLLWLGPFCTIFIAALIVFIRSYRKKPKTLEPLTGEESKRLNQLLNSKS